MTTPKNLDLAAGGQWGRPALACPPDCVQQGSVMFFSNRVPEEARQAYEWDARASFLAGVYISAIFPFLGLIARDRLHASEQAIAFMMAAPFVGNLFALFYAHVMEGQNKLPFVIYPALAARFSLLLMVAVTHAWPFVILVSVAQIFATVTSPAYAAVMADVYPDEYRGRIMSYCRGRMALVTLLVAPLAGWALNQSEDAYRILFPVGALFGVVGTLCFSRVRTRPPVGERVCWRQSFHFLANTVRILKENVPFRWFAMSVFTFGFGNLLTSPLYPIFQVDRLHMTTQQVGLLNNISSAFWMVSYLYWGRFVDRHNPLKAVLINVFLNILIPVNYFLATKPWHLTPSYVIAGITNAGIEMSYFNGILHYSEPNKASQYQALHSSLLGIRGVIAPFIGAGMISYFRHHGYDVRYIFLVSIIFIALGMLMQLAGTDRKQRAGTKG
ncbi:MAG: MFS transporter [Armatimonadetes bacterium]|nr:MFS transporter [Armatimonadota bacterium]